MPEQETATVLTKRAAKQSKDAVKNIAKATEVVVDDVIVEPIVDPIVDETVSVFNRVYNRRRDVGLVAIGVAGGIALSVPLRAKVVDLRTKRAEKKADLKVVREDGDKESGRRRNREAG